MCGSKIRWSLLSPRLLIVSRGCVHCNWTRPNLLPGLCTRQELLSCPTLEWRACQYLWLDTQKTHLFPLFGMRQWKDVGIKDPVYDLGIQLWSRRVLPLIRSWMAVRLLTSGSVSSNTNSTAESPDRNLSVPSITEMTDGKANGIEIKLLSLGLHLTALRFFLTTGCKGGESLVFCSCKTPEYEKWQGILLHSSGCRTGGVHLRRCLTPPMSSQPLLKHEPFLSLSVPTLKQKTMFLT